MESDVAQDLRAAAIAEPDMVKSDHAAPSILLTFAPTCVFMLNSLSGINGLGQGRGAPREL